MFKTYFDSTKDKLVDRLISGLEPFSKIIS